MVEQSAEKMHFIQANSPDGGFLQSDAWRNFQEAYGRRSFCVESGIFLANIITHDLPLVGKYFYVPRGPIMASDIKKKECGEYMQKILALAKNEKASWIRVDLNEKKYLDTINKSLGCQIRKAPHDMQPKENFITDIAKPEEDLLSGMKQKTRYNIRLAEKKNVTIKVYGNSQKEGNKAFEEFLKLVKVTAKRDGITPHPEKYYQKMWETIPAENLKLYVAEFEGKVIAANTIIFFGNTATYLHGSSSDEHRSVMAPYLLQWRAIQDAKKAGCTRYDFGGVSAGGEQSAWRGITRFKTGFSPETGTTKFLGSYDVVVDYSRYNLYRLMQRIKSLL